MLETEDGRRRPAHDTDEKSMLLGFLEFQRATVIAKVSGPSDEELRAAAMPSGLNALGLIKHLAYAERLWFRSVFAGEDVPLAQTAEEWAALFTAAPHETLAGLLHAYRAEIERSNEIVAAASLDDGSRRPDREGIRLRWIMLHMVEEVARHAGHLDLLREKIDGATGE